MNTQANETATPGQTMPTRGPLAVIAWACFLGCSWTWVIGMLWPILLVADFGAWGWLVFAVPNVIGAAAMGFVIARPQASVEVVSAHPQACYRFSEITVAFHVFAVGWVGFFLLGTWGLLAAAGVAIVGVMLAAKRTTALSATAAVTLASLACLLAWLIMGGPESPHAAAGTQRTMGDLLLLTPSVVLGFLLCPYLDLTFHRARQALDPAAGRWAFALGFGVVFLTMIIFTLLYAVAMRPAFTQPTELGTAMPTSLVWVLGIHFTLQAGLTVALHLHELIKHRGHGGAHRVAMLAIAGGALAFWAVSEPTLDAGRVTGELVYRGFLLFYGLAFPAYVWLCMIPTFVPTVAPQARLAVYAVTLLATLPMAYFGFIEGETWWLLACVIVLAFARVVVERLPANRTID
ncbi:hypothetical protein ACERK3_04840 [Phycisphaerales bacterium AB-hyl4]|uniref:Uncharacterized protein n=1 Tax=Natronomicrosphaera hydrolytica TaxID=3242702 RepID=A0ABV4U1Y4_9BACT